MFKAIVVAAIFIVGASCITIEDLENLIDYEETASKAFSLPYPYHGNTDNRVYISPKPYHESKPVLVTLPPSNEVSQPSSGLISSVVSAGFSLVKNGIIFMVSNAPALIVGVVAALGICKLTPLCSKFSEDDYWGEISEDLQSFASNGRLARATEFVTSAIRKYRSLKDNN